MKKLLVPMLVLLAYHFHGQNRTDSNIRPILAAIQVKDLDSCINFYSKYLNLKLIERKRYDDYHLEIALLGTRHFELELVKNDSAIDRRRVLMEKMTSDITGFAKINFKTKRIEQFYNVLKSENINVVIPLRESARKKKLRTFIVTDPEGNWIQFTGN